MRISSCRVTSSPGHRIVRTRAASSSDEPPRTMKSLGIRTGSRSDSRPSGSTSTSSRRSTPPDAACSATCASTSGLLPPSRMTRSAAPSSNRRCMSLGGHCEACRSSPASAWSTHACVWESSETMMTRFMCTVYSELRCPRVWDRDWRRALSCPEVTPRGPNRRCRTRHSPPGTVAVQSVVLGA